MLVLVFLFGSSKGMVRGLSEGIFEGSGKVRVCLFGQNEKGRRVVRVFWFVFSRSENDQG